jgi:hypothetical protein
MNDASFRPVVRGPQADVSFQSELRSRAPALSIHNALATWSLAATNCCQAVPKGGGNPPRFQVLRASYFADISCNRKRTHRCRIPFGSEYKFSWLRAEPHGRDMDRFTMAVLFTWGPDRVSPLLAQAKATHGG